MAAVPGLAPAIWAIARPGGGLYGYWTATPKPETGGRFGFGQSTDGVHWEALPPPEVHGVDGGEVGAITKIGDRYYYEENLYSLLQKVDTHTRGKPFKVEERVLIPLFSDLREDPHSTELMLKRTMKPIR